MMNIFIINSAESKKRRQFQKQQLESLGLNYEIFNAVSERDISDALYKKHYFDWQRPLRKVEVACYYSHQSIWKKVISNNKPSLILEDDALLSIHTKQLLHSLEKLSNVDFVQLETRNRTKIIHNTGIEVTPEFKVHRLYYDKNGAAGYVLWPSGAKKLIRHEESRGIGLADAHISSCYKLTGYQVNPAAVIQLDQCSAYGMKAPIRVNSLILNKDKPIDENILFFKLKRIVAILRMTIRRIKYIQFKFRKIELNKKGLVK